jgi:light-harvesting complex 1 beta chain
MTDLTASSVQTFMKGESKSFGAIFAVCFVILLAIALVAQKLGWHWRSWLPGAEGVESLNDGVKVAVYNFMSQLL